MTTKGRLSIKKLESYLQDLDDFDEPKINLEQYATPPHIAALMLSTIDSSYDDIQDKLVADLGCGTGRLSVGSILCGARMVFGFDSDEKALKQLLGNLQNVYCEDENSEDYVNVYRACPKINLIQADVATKEQDALWATMVKKFDTVIMNPPFGTKNNAGLDVVFLKRAIDMASSVVYSLHKSSTRDYISRKCQQWTVEGKPIAQIRYNLESTYKFHKRKSVDIEVDLWRITVPSL